MNEIQKIKIFVFCVLVPQGTLLLTFYVRTLRIKIS